MNKNILKGFVICSSIGTALTFGAFVSRNGSKSGPKTSSTCQTRTGSDSQTSVTPGIVENASGIPEKPHLKVYIENSGSMDGYVKGATKFEQAIYSYVSDIDIKEAADSLSLYYVNSKLIPQGDNLSDFILELEPISFKAKGGKRSTTDISKLCELVFENTTGNTVSLLVSDFIFSPGNNDAESYLMNQQIAIKSHVAEHLKSNPNHGFAVLQLTSQFDGYFYDKADKPIKYKGDRPFYMWLIGDKGYIKTLSQESYLRTIKGGGVHHIYSVADEVSGLNYAVKIGSGQFEPDRKNTKHSLKNLSKNSRSGKANFSVNVDFSSLLCDNSYLLDVNNYQLSDPDYKLEVLENHAGDEYTHILKLSTSIIKPSTLIISLKSKLPSWVNALNDDNGVGIHDENKDKTFGIKYLLGGLYEGVTVNTDKCAKLKININK